MSIMDEILAEKDKVIDSLTAEAKTIVSNKLHTHLLDSEIDSLSEKVKTEGAGFIQSHQSEIASAVEDTAKKAISSSMSSASSGASATPASDIPENVDKNS